MISAVIRRARFLLLPPDPESLTNETRGAERNRRAALTGGVATIARVVQVSSSLITVPLTLRYLGKERFGLWMTISSVLAMAAFADFGIGNGVLNTVAKAYGRDDTEAIRKAVSSGFAVLNSIALALIVFFFAVYRFVNWADFFRVVSPQARTEAGPALAVFAVCFALNISMDVVQRVQLGLQQGYRFSMWQLCGSLFGFMGVLTGIWMRVTLPVLVVAIAGAPILATTLNAFHFFGMVRPDLRPARKLVERDVIFQIAKLGIFFFLLQVVAAISYSADNLIIARTLGAVSVPEYSVPQRMFALITMMSGMLVAPLWPAYSEAASRGHMDWVRRTLVRSLLIVLAWTSVASIVLLLMGSTLIHWWVGTTIHPPFMLLFGLAIWTVVASCGDALGMFLNGLELMRFEVITASIFGVACVLAKIYFVRRFGAVGVPWATLIAHGMFIVVPCAIYVPYFFRRLNRETAITKMTAESRT